MTCSFPDLQWARMRVYADGTSDVLECDGLESRFPSEDEARWYLGADEYDELSDLDEEDEAALGQPLTSLKPPSGVTTEEVVPQMYIKSS
jgi:hypothetical protein